MIIHVDYSRKNRQGIVLWRFIGNFCYKLVLFFSSINCYFKIFL